MKKAIGILLLLVVLAAGGYFGFKLLFPAEEKEAEQPAQEEVVTEVSPEEKTWKDSVDDVSACVNAIPSDHFQSTLPRLSKMTNSYICPSLCSIVYGVSPSFVMQSSMTSPPCFSSTVSS